MRKFNLTIMVVLATAYGVTAISDNAGVDFLLQGQRHERSFTVQALRSHINQANDRKSGFAGSLG